MTARSCDDAGFCIFDIPLQTRPIRGGLMATHDAFMSYNHAKTKPVAAAVD
jgi:hypothetical protein